MPYLDGRAPLEPIVTFGKPKLTTSTDMFNKWKPHAPLAKDRLKFGLTHPDKKISQVREKPERGFTLKMSNLWKQKDVIPLKIGITTSGKPSQSGPQFPNYKGGIFHTQSPQIQTRNGSTIKQYKKDGKI